MDPLNEQLAFLAILSLTLLLWLGGVTSGMRRLREELKAEQRTDRDALLREIQDLRAQVEHRRGQTTPWVVEVGTPNINLGALRREMETSPGALDRWEMRMFGYEDDEPILLTKADPKAGCEPRTVNR